MKQPLPWLLAAAAALAILAGVYALSGGGAGEEDAGAGEAEVVAPVQTAPAEAGSLPRHVIGHGRVVAAPGASVTLSVPFEARVDAVLVAPGEAVPAGGEVARLVPSVAAAVAYAAAQRDAQAAAETLAGTNRRVQERLATSAERVAAEQAKAAADAVLAGLEEAGSGGPQTLTAPIGVVVTGLPAEVGAVLPAGAPLAVLAPADRLEARLGIDPADADALAAGQPVALAVPGVAGDSAGLVRRVTRSVDPASGRLAVAVAFAADGAAPPPLGRFVRGEIEVGRAAGLLLPRSGLVVGPQGDRVFSVKDGHAVEHAVEVLLREDERIVVASDTLATGDQVVVVGTLGLEDGMAVSPSAGGGR